MAKGFTISFEGLEQTIKELKTTVADIEEKVDFAIGVNVEAMATEAKNRVASLSVDTGRLINSISADKKAKYQYELIAGVYYAPYIEFGTGKYAEEYVKGIDSEWEKLAFQFFRTGNGKLKEKPYLYPAYKRIFPIMVKDIQNLVNKDVRL